MPNYRYLDLLQGYSFWVYDATGIQGNAGASVFDPVLGFSACTVPRWTTTVKAVKEGNFPFPRNVLQGAQVSPLTLSRGARWYDSDFYNWLMRALKGIQPVRRDLFLIQFLGLRPVVSTGRGRISLPPENGLTVFTTRIPGRVWYLRKCIPTEYVPGSDFDADSGEVSIATLTFQPNTVDEVTTATISELAARSFSMGIATAGIVQGLGL